MDLVAVHLKHCDMLGADKGYDTQAFSATLEHRGIKAHNPRHTNGRRSAIDARKARGKNYAMNLVIRKRIEQGYGRVKIFGGLSKLPCVGLEHLRGWVEFNFAAHNLTLIGNIGQPTWGKVRVALGKPGKMR